MFLSLNLIPCMLMYGDGECLLHTSQGHTNLVQSCFFSCSMPQCARHIQEANPRSDHPFGTWKESREHMWCHNIYLCKISSVKKSVGNLVSSRQDWDGHDVLRLDFDTGTPAHLPSLGTIYGRPKSLSNDLSHKINLSSFHIRSFWYQVRTSQWKTPFALSQSLSFLK